MRQHRNPYGHVNREWLSDDGFLNDVAAIAVGLLATFMFIGGPLLLLLWISGYFA